MTTLEFCLFVFPFIALFGYVKTNYDAGVDLVLSDLWIMVLVSAIPVANAVILVSCIAESDAVLLKGKKQ